MTQSTHKNRQRHHWTEAQTAQLRALYPNTRGADVAAALGLRASQVYQMAARLGIAKSVQFNASGRSGRIQKYQRNPSMVGSQFQPGQVPWNKGKPGLTGVQDACRATQFKKGQMTGAAQHNYKPIGSIRTSKDGYLERKMTVDPSLYPDRRWVAVHRLVWQAAGGPIAPGSIVIFKPGQRTAVLANITADRLEMITRAEHARRNHPRSVSPELGRLVQLKGAITRQVNRIAKEHKEHNQHTEGLPT